MKTKITLTKNSKILFGAISVMLVVAVTYMYVIEPFNSRRILAQSEIDNLQYSIESLKAQQPDMPALQSQLANLQETRNEQLAAEEQQGGVATNAGGIDTSSANLLTAFGGLSEELGLRMNRFELVSEGPDSNIYGMSMYGQYQDISVFFQSLEKFNLNQKMNSLYVQKVLVDEKTGVPITTQPVLPPSSGNTETPNISTPSGSNNPAEPATNGGSSTSTNTPSSSGEATSNPTTPNTNTSATGTAGEPSSTPQTSTENSTNNGEATTEQATPNTNPVGEIKVNNVQPTATNSGDVTTDGTPVTTATTNSGGSQANGQPSLDLGQSAEGSTNTSTEDAVQPVNEEQVLAGPNLGSGTTGYEWSFGEFTEILADTPLFDPISGDFFEKSNKTKIQVVFTMSIPKQTNDNIYKVSTNTNFTPSDPFKEARDVLFNGRFGFRYDDVGNGTSPFSKELINKLQTDAIFRNKEIIRTRAVVDNRKNAGLNIDAQLNYLQLLLHMGTVDYNVKVR